MVDVAQLVRAPVCGTGGRGFKSRHPPHYFFLRRILGPKARAKGIFVSFCSSFNYPKFNFV